MFWSFKKIATRAIGVVAVLAVLGFIVQVVDPEGTKRRAEEAKARAEQRREKQAASDKQAADARKAKAEADAKDKKKTDRIFTNGFTVGYFMAKNGAVKPTGDQVDALARKAAKDLGDQGGWGFTMAWKDAFWAGWRKGD